MRRSVNSALEVARGIVGQVGSGQDVPAAEQLFAAVREFQLIEFEVPDGEEADGFLFQYGEVDWYPEPTFVVNFVRQLEIVDADGEHEAYSQVQLEYRYRVDPELSSIEDHESWWFPEEDEPFGEWLEAARQDPIWTVVRGKVPVGFEVTQEIV